MKDMINKLKDLRNVAQTLKSLDRENPDPQVIQKTLEESLGVKISDLENLDVSPGFDEKKSELKVKFVNRSSHPDPKYVFKGDSGFDFRASIPEDIMVIKPGKRKLVPTGNYFEVPYGYELQVRPKSGLALKHGITVLNTPGTVDSNYRGEVKVILINLGDEPFTINDGDRIAQGVLCPILNKDWSTLTKVDSLSDSDRQSGGFGSTGIK
tara:strand:- start:30412 stop:31041 length:630 start_codon:yes stop_codon:yes gene_type:complete